VRKIRIGRVFLICILVVLIFSIYFLEVPFPKTIPVSGANETRTGIIIPMFPLNFSQNQIDEIMHVKQAYPEVPFIVIVNYGNGPGSSYSIQRAESIKSMQHAGITVLGYDPTVWGERSLASTEKDMVLFFKWYHVEGIYLDQVLNSEFNSKGTFLGSYYSSLTNYAHSLGMTKVVGNSGTDVPYYLVGTVDQMGIFENAFTPPLSYLAGWHLSYNKSNFWFVSYNISAPNPYYVASASDYVGYMYLTNGEYPYPYADLPLRTLTIWFRISPQWCRSLYPPKQLTVQ
jgi:hypothetical protein